MQRKITINLDSEVVDWLEERAGSAAISRDSYILQLLQQDSRLDCRGCGQRNPIFWMVPTKVWKHYIKAPEREAILCLSCWKSIVERSDGGAFQERYGKPAVIDDAENRRIHKADIARAYRRFPPGRLTLIGLHPKDWRLVRSVLLKGWEGDYERLTAIASLIDYELRNRARFHRRSS
jgi:hypothetical protein